MIRIKIIFKNGVPFEEAASIFLNKIMEEPDLDHSEAEERRKYYERQL